MSGRNLLEGRTGPVTQSVDSVKSLLMWKGRAVDPLPSKIELVNQEEDSRLMLILSNKKDGYYVTTATKCSCPSATYRHSGPCKHQRRYFPQEQAAKPAATTEPGSIKPAGKWPGGHNGPVDECKGAA